MYLVVDPSMRTSEKLMKERNNFGRVNIVNFQHAKNYLKGVPAQTETPGQLNIPIVLWLWNLIKAFDLTKYAKMRYNLMGNAEHWFPGCKPNDYLNIDRTELRQSLKASPYADRIIEILDEANVLMKAEETKRLSKED